MQTFELLDRFELLYPTKSNLADLRRAYTDKDLSSIFRLVNDNNKEDLRKLVMEDNTWKLWPILDSYVETQFVAAFKNFFVNETKIWDDCFSRGQLQSKLWLVQELQKLNVDLGTVYLCAGWYATLATMLFESKCSIDKIRSFDMDPSCAAIAEIFNKKYLMQDWKYKAVTQDILDIDYVEHSYNTLRSDGTECPLVDWPDTVINTSCEHFNHHELSIWWRSIPKGKLVVIQSNNYKKIKEHLGCVNNISQFAELTPMRELLYAGQMKFENYTRYMRIGYK